MKTILFGIDFFGGKGVVMAVSGSSRMSGGMLRDLF
jgi:hypothetical protein